VNRTLVGEVQALCTSTVLDQQTLELARSLELRSGAYRAPALPVELYQRSWRGDSNADHGLTRPALFPLSYTSTFSSNIWRRWGELHSRCSALQADALLSWLHRLEHTYQLGAEGGTRTRALDVGNVASWPLDDFRPHKIMERAARVELASSGDERPSRRVITPVAVATGVEPVPPDRQSGILPLDSATAFYNLAARARFERA
jgi:hypothetical protein